MANTFFKAQGLEMADSLVEDEAVETAKNYLKTGGKKFMLPIDVVLGDKFDAEAAMKDNETRTRSSWLANPGYWT